jgi:hypothetical protein
MGELLAALAMLTAGALAAGARALRRDGEDPEATRNLAEALAHRLRLSASGCRLHGTLHGFEASGVVSADAVSLRLLTDSSTGWSRDAHGDRLVTGDAAFDAAVGFVSARAGLDASTRAALIDAVAVGVVHEGGEARLRAHGTLDELINSIGLAVRACRAVRDDAATPVSLAASDPEPLARLLALRRARGPEVTREWLRARRDDPHPLVACEAALRLGDEGVEWLLAQLAEPSRVHPALHALARSSIDRPDSRLLAALAAELPLRPEPPWLELAGRAGTVALVPVLRRVGSVDALHALRQIQARATGEAGSISLAAVEGGALSHAGGDGRVSEPLDPDRP